MHSLTVPTEHNPNDHTPTEILSALRGHGGGRRFSFRHALVTAQGQYLQDLDGVDSCVVTQDWLADIKRTAQLRIRETGVIDYLSDQVQPWVRLHVPPYQSRDWVEWPQGVFLLSSPTRQVSEAGVVTRSVQAYDRLQILAEDQVDSRFTLAQGANYVDAVKSILVPLPTIATASALTAPTAREWPPGTTKLRIVNDILDTINYQSLSFDEWGRGIVAPYRSPSERPEEYVYADDRDSLIMPEAEQSLDLFKVPNKWVLVVSDPDRDDLRAVYVNSDPGSPTSTVRRQRTITDFRTEQDAPDLGTLTQRAARLAFQASQVYESVPFRTGLMPIHSGNDVYRIRFSPLALDARYAEQSWRMELRAGARMEHLARRVVSV